MEHRYFGFENFKCYCCGECLTEGGAAGAVVETPYYGNPTEQRVWLVCPECAVKVYRNEQGAEADDPQTF